MKDYKKKIYDNYLSNRVVGTIPSDMSSLNSRKPFYLDVIKKHFPTNKEIKVLDLGCGYGAFLHFMRERGYRSAQGVDSSIEMVEAATKLGITEITHGDLFSFLKEKPDESIDVITAIDIIEHFTKSEIFDLVAEMKRVLKKGGRIISHQPNAEGVFGNAILYGDFTHEVSFTRNSMAQVFLGSGFSSLRSFEDKPLRYNFKSFICRVIWDVFIRPLYRFLVVVESKDFDKEIIFTKNFLSVIIK